MPVSGVCAIALHHRRSRLCEDAVVFQQMVDWVSGSNWSYVAIFAVAVIDAFFPVVPSESMVIVAGTLAGAGDLNVFLVILAAWAGAVVGDNISYGIGKWAGERTVRRLFRHEKAHKGFDWAEQQLEERGSYIILDRPVHPVRAHRGHVHRRATRRGCPGIASSATTSSPAGSGRPTRRCSATSAASSSRSSRGRACCSGSAIAFTVAFVIEWVRNRRGKKQTPSLIEAGTARPGPRYRGTFSMMRVHVTGATGFLGSELLRLAPPRRASGSRCATRPPSSRSSRRSARTS